MGPLDTLYEMIGNRFPVLSNVIACIVGAVVFGFGWYSIGRHYRAEHAKNSNVPQVMVPANLPKQDAPLSPQPAENSSSKAERKSSKRVIETRTDFPSSSRTDPAAINQAMTNSPGGMQAGRDITIREKPFPLPTPKDKKP